MYKALLLFILALLPIIILGYYTYSKDSNKEPKKLLLKLFFGGFGAVFLTIILSLVLQSIFPALSGDVEEYGNLKLLLYSFCIISFVEEISKFIFIYLISYHNKEYDQLYDMIVYSVFVALGFALIENLLYVFEGGLRVAISRLIFAVPTHASVAVFMGYYLSFAKLADINNNKKLKNKYLILSLLVPITLHGVYDYMVYSNSYIMYYLFFFFTIILFVKANKKLKEISLMTMTIKNDRCPHCGAYMQNESLCEKCSKNKK